MCSTAEPTALRITAWSQPGASVPQGTAQPLDVSADCRSDCTMAERCMPEKVDLLFPDKQVRTKKKLLVLQTSVPQSVASLLEP